MLTDRKNLTKMSKQKISKVEVPQARTPDLVSRLVSGAAMGPSRSEGHSVSFGHVDARGRVGLDVSKAPVPSRRYATELCTVDSDGRDMRIVFAQSAIFGDEIETALVVRMNPTAVVQFAESVINMVDPTLDELAGLVKVSREPLLEIKSRPHQTVKVVANLISVAIAGHEACLDFYHASAFAVRKSEGQNKLDVEPVVRVDIRTGLFLSLNDRIQEIASQLAMTYK
jgi:hypothetical protein